MILNFIGSFSLIHIACLLKVLVWIGGERVVSFLKIVRLFLGEGSFVSLGKVVAFFRKGLFCFCALSLGVFFLLFKIVGDVG